MILSDGLKLGRFRGNLTYIVDGTHPRQFENNIVATPQVSLRGAFFPLHTCVCHLSTNMPNVGPIFQPCIAPISGRCDVNFDIQKQTRIIARLNGRLNCRLTNLTFQSTLEPIIIKMGNHWSQDDKERTRPRNQFFIMDVSCNGLAGSTFTECNLSFTSSMQTRFLAA